MPEKRAARDFEQEEIIQLALKGAGNHTDGDFLKGAYTGWDRAEDLLGDLEKKFFSRSRVEAKEDVGSSAE